MSVTAVEVQDIAQQTSQVATPDGEHEQHKSPVSRKRKREELETTVIDLKDVLIRPFPGSIYDKPHLLKPLRLIPRSRLPLTFLDTSASPHLLSSSRLFTSSIDALERDTTENLEPRVLVAAFDNGSQLFAIERVKPKVYALCKLYHWVQIGYIEEGQDVQLEQLAGAAMGAEWWHGAAVQHANTTIPKKRLRLSMGDRLEVGKPSLPPQAPPTTQINPVEAPLVEASSLTMPAEEQKSCEEIFETLIRQYLEAVYISKTSLAFFAKGPLSRARNAFVGENSTGLASDLVAQLGNMLLSMAQMDKKYREKLPEAIKSFPAHTMSEDELERPFVTKKRRSKKVPKLSREGYYPIEEDYCKRWWSSNQSANARARPDETFEQLQKRRIGDLRRRETLAQIILILEILALESSPDFQAAQADTFDSQTRESQIEADGDSQLPNTEDSTPFKKPKRKQKKQQDLALLLDLLLDKLSIWQSIEQDLGITDPDKKRDTVAENSEKLQEQDILAGFCTDVVIPFYKSRIPTQASLVNIKLGGPGAVSPDKSKSRDASKSMPKPGDRRSRKPLQKTLSETNGFIRSRPPSLSRSATDTQGMSRFKREASELSLFDIPLAKPSHRDSSSQLKHLKSRQVDLTAISTATESRLKKQAKIQEDLKEAIGNIAKPNRGQAVRELVDAADKRSLGSASMRKKTMAPVKKVLQTVRNVQVTATPKHRRAFNALAESKVERQPEMQEHAPSSGDFCVPSSGVRTTNPDVVGATPAVSRSIQMPRPAFAVAGTPSRKTKRPLDTDDLVDELHSTPAELPALDPSLSSFPTSSNSSFGDFLRSQMKRKPAASTPLKPASRSMGLSSTPVKAFSISATPAKATLHSSPPGPDIVTAETPMKSGAAPEASAAYEQSIYDALGWNDYDDE